ncbi:uncharacterized protein LOC112165124 [Rosa chinensis]|uniref:uncharacterized protein LOC112165124 n=1 Tax=Rosa chinensis TaxID=74649 RepID=UPI001AD8EFE5|nr:uncharacterized protein LOC112165124 [Rosa chinensis]
MILIQLGTTPCTCYRKRLDCAGELLQLRGYLKLIELGLKVHGALRCLAFLSMDLDDTVVPKLILALFPCLLTIVSSPQVCDKYLRTKSYSIVYSCIAVMGVMSGVYKNGEEAGCQFRGRNLNAHQLQLLHVKSCKSLSIFLMDFVVMEVLKLF